MGTPRAEFARPPALDDEAADSRLRGVKVCLLNDVAAA